MAMAPPRWRHENHRCECGRTSCYVQFRGPLRRRLADDSIYSGLYDGNSVTSPGPVTVLSGGTVVTMDPDRRVLRDAAVAMSPVSGRLMAVGPAAQLRADFRLTSWTAPGRWYSQDS